MEQFKNMDIDKMKKSRDELQALFQSFMLQDKCNENEEI